MIQDPKNLNGQQYFVIWESRSRESFDGLQVQLTSDIRDADIRDFHLQGTISNNPNDFQCKIILKYSLIRDPDIRDFCL